MNISEPAPAANLGLPAPAAGYLDAIVDSCRADKRIVGVLVAGSGAAGRMDRFSDLDTVIVCADEHQPELLASAPAFAGALGPLLVAFTGEHVGEPRLLICLYGPPVLHVDLKFTTLSDLAHRVEDGIVAWQRGTAVTDVLESTMAVWPQPDPQWIEDRFWVWVHYGATKIGRGELFEALDTLAGLRGMVLGPLLARRGGYQAQGARRLEERFPDVVPALRATLGDHTPAGCVAALRAAITLYRELRDGESGLHHHFAAEKAAMAYLDEVAGHAMG